ncbi:acetoacetate decarboxylase family protein [Mycolicibacter arupensis]|uniref:Acetoacetate decarboxylase n=1 Tax=Mycolicibacter arupensis TaxID=342002 RepID=A0A0M2WC20_9MYCO|nr:acetoacetate decarboxylase family protein [Mycolicibacter arupensis]KAA1431764.1 acetoacetate decarboxylase [Mycolicibacter arupensis]KKO60797.1 acetoacetate decarboxylase [Mycolicibacter arupensis]MCV7275732.1 acetoacetate decarboxylase family protein [Mycolicibacter arupensis]OQZ97127.1 acetoacetate decarboxylase [Mycolicibacter arupensis]TXI57740.1 MAG: acetoacetate decarboxylase [Mycolicibacter arupensis]
MALSQHTIAGTVLTMPVRIRHADVHSAMFSVPADAAQQMIDYSGLQVFQQQPGRAVVNLMLARYIDGDLGRYLEFGTAVMVNPPGTEASGWRALGSAGAFIHHLPVDQEFTLEAGRTIWGFPKILADFTVRDGEQFGFDVAADGQHIATMEFSRGLPAPSLFTSRPRVLQAFSHLDGVTRQTPWEMRVSKVRGALGGTQLRLGTHPYARELAALGLPKRPMMSSTVGRVEMTFGDAHALGR